MRHSIMLARIMKFLNRLDEMERLDRLAARQGGGLVIVYGRRRIGKTRLLLEWSRRHRGLYTVADQSSADIQRRYFAQSVAERLPGFGDVEYPDWRTLLSRLARDAEAAAWRGPLIVDELPYLVSVSPELPSLLQRWIDHEAENAQLIVALAGSSQRMMQGLVLSRDAPLFGRAHEILDLGPIDPSFLAEAFSAGPGRELVELYTAWGGIPRYWELAAEVPNGVFAQIESLVLDRLGPLHSEPDRVLLEDIPPALELRPVLDAIGAGAHRISEIGARLGRATTSMTRPLDRLVGMGLVRREIPFGETEKESRRGLYKIDDPFFRLWFRVVAPHRGPLASGTRQTRRAWLMRFWEDLAARAWEDLCRARIALLGSGDPLGSRGPWKPAARWWKGNDPEWDLVSESLDGRRLLLGEVKWSAKPFGGLSGARALARARADLAARLAPALPARFDRHETVRALFVPELESGGEPDGREPWVITASDLFQPPSESS